jgi:hypothetical protein
VDNEVGEVGCLRSRVHKGERVRSTFVQTEPPGLSFALGVANGGLHRPGGS